MIIINIKIKSELSVGDSISTNNISRKGTRDSVEYSILKSIDIEFTLDVIPFNKLSYDIEGRHFNNPEESKKQIQRVISEILRKIPISPIIIDSSGNVLDGQHRMAAYNCLEVTDVPVLRPTNKEMVYDNLVTRMERLNIDPPNPFYKHIVDDKVNLTIEDLNNLSGDGLEDIMAEAYFRSDEALMETYNFITKNKPELGNELKGELAASLDSSAYFLEDSHLRFLSRWAKRRIRKIEGEDFKKDVKNKFGDDLIGLELSNAKGTMFALILPCASNEGKFRISYYDDHGFSNHITGDSYDELLKDLIRDKYTTFAEGALNRVSQLKSFNDGNEFVSKIALVNNRIKTFGEVFLSDENSNPTPQKKTTKRKIV